MNIAITFYVLAMVAFAVAYKIEPSKAKTKNEREANISTRIKIYGVAAAFLTLGVIKHYVTIYGCIEGLEIFKCG